MEPVAEENREIAKAWDGPLFEAFLDYKDLTIAGLGPHGERALDLHPPAPGSRVLDIGCGFGDASIEIAKRVGPQGSVLGVDVAERFIEAAREDAAAAGAENVSFEVADVQASSFDQEFDYAFSRFGTMFFAAPVPALRNVREALAPGGKLCMVVWRQKPDNPWLHETEKTVQQFLEKPEESDVPTCGPGPFSMAGADTVSDVMVGAGFGEIGLQRTDLPFKIGADVEQAVAYNMALGPGAEVLRLWGDRVDEVRPKVASAIRGALEPFDTGDGIVLGASTWVVTGTAPGA